MKASAGMRSRECKRPEPPRTRASSSRLILALLLVTAVALPGCATPKGPTNQAKRENVLRMADAALGDFYQADPRLKLKVRHAPGYAVFSTRGLKIFVFGSGNGYGVAHDNTTGNNTYMRMGRFGGGVGMGMTDNRTLFIFKTDQALGSFVDRGIEIGGDANAAARFKDDGISYQLGVVLQKEMEIYQLTRTGLAAEAMVYGTKYWKDGNLNN